MDNNNVIGISFLSLSGIAGFFNSEILMFFFGITAIYFALRALAPKQAETQQNG
jgi:hypothetical protein